MIQNVAFARRFLDVLTPVPRSLNAQIVVEIAESLHARLTCSDALVRI